MDVTSTILRNVAQAALLNSKDQQSIDALTSSIHTRLSKTFDLKRFSLIGSHARDTAIRKTSDVDYIAVFARDEARWGGALKSSSTFLNNVRRDLAQRFWNTEISKDGQAVVIEFVKGGQSFDIVPAFFLKINKYKRPSYLIPDGRGGWLETSPEAHNKFIEIADMRSRGKLRNVARIFKSWRQARVLPVPISSFHVELLLATLDICSGVKTYGQCVVELFNALEERECRGLQDPLGISGVIPASSTEAKRLQALFMVKGALAHARKAQFATSIGKEKIALDQWDIVFNRKLLNGY